MSIGWRVVGVIILTLAVPVLPFVTVGELPGERWLSSADGSALQFGIAGAALLAVDVVLPVPSSVLGTLLGARLGLVQGFVWTFAGLTLGQAIGYGVGRLALRRLDASLPKAPTLAAVFLSRPVPVLAEAMTMTAGATRTPFAQFLAFGAAGNAAYAAALSANGAAFLPADLVGPGLVLPMAVPALGWLAWRWQARRAAP